MVFVQKQQFTVLCAMLFFGFCLRAFARQPVKTPKNKNQYATVHKCYKTTLFGKVSSFYAKLS